ncbi:Acg family FMN-binding oxidoreductase [Hyphococcus luteus]|uniref:Acg family FMN-binding oxidoreductase n=1 Tax=Hyphococcus luteus TaxID=2058213 RepID=UPI0013FD876A|nr:twin-arginine translocation pathway signal protein [Marinicaulis flavus]
MVSRRVMLITGGAGVALIGAAAFRLHSNLGPARKPWFEAGEGYDDPRLDALSYAVLAPSPHNLQPWLIRLDGDDGLTLFCDLERRLPETDPLDRQTVIGLGAFLELLRQAAAEMGYALETDAFPEGEAFPVLDKRPIASVRFVKTGERDKDPLFAALLKRRTARSPFDQSRPVSAETLNALDSVLRAEDGEFEWANDDANLEMLKEICRKAWRTEMTTPGPRHESASYTRIGEKQINAHPDGISLSGPVMEAMGAFGVLTQDAMDDPDSTAFAETIKFYEKNIDTAMAFGWLTTENNSRKDQLRSGAGWVRLQQAAAGMGLSMQPFSQALEEYPEMAEILEEIHDFAGLRAPARMQGLFRFGYGKDEPPAPRWPLETRLVNADA